MDLRPWSSTMLSRIRGKSSSASIPRISRGTPGSIATHRPSSSSSQIPGALPCLLESIAAPSGIIACAMLDSGKGPVRPEASPSLLASTRAMASSRCISRPNIFAIDGLRHVVGGRTKSTRRDDAPVRSSASLHRFAMSSAVSPTVVRRTISTPIAASSRARCAEFVSTVNPSSSSSPMVTIFDSSSAHPVITRP